VFLLHATANQLLKRLLSLVHCVNSILIDIDCNGVSLQTSGTLVSIIVLLCVVLHPQNVASVITIARIVIAASELVDSSFIVPFLYFCYQFLFALLLDKQVALVTCCRRYIARRKIAPRLQPFASYKGQDKNPRLRQSHAACTPSEIGSMSCRFVSSFVPF
jgi:hypothetical protein